MSLISLLLQVGTTACSLRSFTNLPPSWTMSYVKAGTMSHLCLKCSCSDVMLFGWMNSGSITVYHRVKAPNENIVGLCMSFIVEMQNKAVKANKLFSSR